MRKRPSASQAGQRKIDIDLSESKTMLHLIANLLRKYDIGFETLSSDVAVDKRGPSSTSFPAILAARSFSPPKPAAPDLTCNAPIR
jgi:hypothetical protein